MRVPLDEAVRRAASQLEAAGASEAMAVSTAVALVLAEAQGISSHGLARVAQYATHLRNGRVDGEAEASIAREHGAALLIDARDGFASPACELAIARGVQIAKKLGVCFAGVTNSHHAGVLLDHLRPAAAAELVGLGFANSPAAAPAAAIFPRAKGDPLMLDLSAKDEMLALMVELLVTALTGAHIGFEASSFFAGDGNRPRIGQAFILIDPGALAGRVVYDERVETLVARMLVSDDVRLVGERRRALERRARDEGIELPPGL